SGGPAPPPYPHPNYFLTPTQVRLLLGLSSSANGGGKIMPSNLNLIRNSVNVPTPTHPFAPLCVMMAALAALPLFTPENAVFGYNADGGLAPFPYQGRHAPRTNVNP